VALHLVSTRVGVRVIITKPISSSVVPSIAFVTGVDAEMFGQIFLLLGSLRRNSPEVWLYVCDLGLTDAQRRYLQQTRRLLPRPDGRHFSRHVWYDKAALGAYTKQLNADCLVWLDADLIILNNIMPLVQAVCAEMQAKSQTVAAAGSTISGASILTLDALDWLDQAPGFKKAMSSLYLKSPYLNSGVIICRSQEFLARWAGLCEALPYEFLYEQNAFNLAAYEQPECIQLLDLWAWNLCGPAFRSVEVVATGGDDLAVIGQSGRVNILHVTSTERAKDLIRYDYHLSVKDTFFRPQFRIVKCFDALADYQVKLVTECIAAEAPALIASGFGGLGEPVLGTLKS
jgi:hypothetical protein